jgi:hypothetical protein
MTVGRGEVKMKPEVVIPRDESFTGSMINADLPTDFNELQREKEQIEV